MDRQTFDKILLDVHVDLKLEDLQQTGILRQLFPEIQAMVGFGGRDEGHKDLWAHTKQVVKQTLPQSLLRWAALFHDVGKPQSFSTVHGKITFHHHEGASAHLFKKSMAKKTLLSPSEIEEVTFVIRHLGNVEAYDSSWSDSAVRRLTRELEPHLESVFAVARADCTTANPTKRQKQMATNHELKTRIDTLKALDLIPPALPSGLGDAVMKHLNLTPSRELGEILTRLKCRVEAGELPRNAEIAVYLQAL